MVGLVELILVWHITECIGRDEVVFTCLHFETMSHAWLPSHESVIAWLANMHSASQTPVFVAASSMDCPVLLLIKGKPTEKRMKRKKKEKPIVFKPIKTL